ncbi:hypothetical protein NQ314_007380 [Rhamnusium bicolor]|uniref:Lipocalin-like domain-containing protein n=1 Tax=Rhamnusium bicolor TaxID=1586634 RepID=A0AAV8YPJ4_9CUCU|nr:hypothetical protein NQ314_007380 [Rhamnusium bicolor]
MMFETNTEMYIRGSVKKYKRDGEEYLKTNKLYTKITVGDGHIKLTEKDQDLQFGGKNAKYKVEK